MDEFIVAEVSKNWESGITHSPLVSQSFEKVINTNWGRGYELESWKLCRIVGDYGLAINETIVAVFRKRKDINDG